MTESETKKGDSTVLLILIFSFAKRIFTWFILNVFLMETQLPGVSTIIFYSLRIIKDLGVAKNTNNDFS